MNHNLIIQFLISAPVRNVMKPIDQFWGREHADTEAVMGPHRNVTV
jgi:hypothetical protein